MPYGNGCRDSDLQGRDLRHYSFAGIRFILVAVRNFLLDTVLYLTKDFTAKAD